MADKTRKPKVQKKQVTCFTKQEQRAIEQEIFRRDNPKLYGIIISLYTGIRIGELLALTWSDIDLTRGVLTVLCSLRRVRTQRRIYREYDNR